MWLVFRLLKSQGLMRDGMERMVDGMAVMTLRWPCGVGLWGQRVVVDWVGGGCCARCPLRSSYPFEKEVYKTFDNER